MGTTVEWSGVLAGRATRVAVRMAADGGDPFVVSWLACLEDGTLVEVSPYQLRAILPELRRLFEEVQCLH